MNKREKLFIAIFFLFILTLCAFILSYQEWALTDRVEIPSSGSIKTTSSAVLDQLEIAEQIYAYFRARGWYIYIHPEGEGWGIHEPGNPYNDIGVDG